MTNLPFERIDRLAVVRVPLGNHRSLFASLATPAIVAVALLAVGCAGSESPQILRFVVEVPPGEELALGWGSVAVSPDGGRLAYVATREGVRRLFLLEMDESEAVVIAGTEDAFDPFFSPDGQWVGFFTDDKLKKVSVRGGPPVTLCDAANSRGASWGPDDTIVFAAGSPTSLSRVSSGGGVPEILTTPDPEQREFGHLWPVLLPNGRAVLFAIDTGEGFDNALIAVQSLETGERKVLLEGGTAPRYAPTVHIVYAREDKLLAVPFDLEDLVVTGHPIPVLENVAVNRFLGFAQFSFSRDGLLAYMPTDYSEAKRRLVWVDRNGGVEPLPSPDRAYRLPRVSPNGQRVAVVISTLATSDIWTYDLQREALAQLTELGRVSAPVWTPDGEQIAFVYGGAALGNLYWQAADGSASGQSLWGGQYSGVPTSWSPDGKMLAIAKHDPPTGWDIFVLRMGDEPLPLVHDAHAHSGRLAAAQAFATAVPPRSDGAQAAGAVTARGCPHRRTTVTRVWRVRGCRITHWAHGNDPSGEPPGRAPACRIDLHGPSRGCASHERPRGAGGRASRSAACATRRRGGPLGRCRVHERDRCALLALSGAARGDLQCRSAGHRDRRDASSHRRCFPDLRRAAGCGRGRAARCR